MRRRGRAAGRKRTKKGEGQQRKGKKNWPCSTCKHGRTGKRASPKKKKKEKKTKEKKRGEVTIRKGMASPS